MLKKILSVILLTFIIISLVPALGEYTAVTTAKTDVYESASKSARKLGTLASGTQVTVTAEKGGWARIERSGRTGYAESSSLKKQPAKTVTMYVKSDGLAVYESPKTSSKKLGTLRKGASVLVTAVKNGWAQLVNGDRVGYCAAASLGSEKPAETEKKYVSAITLTVYESPKTSSKKLGTLKYAAAVNERRTRGGWSEIVNGSRVGYVKSESLTGSEPYARTAYVNVESAVIYSKASTSSSAIAKLGVNSKLTVIAISSDGKWTRVICNDKIGYCPKSSLGASKITLYAKLSNGSTGEAVKKLQKRLIALGYYSGNADGKYLSMTAAAVRMFQKKAKLTETGVADDATQKALYSTDAPNADGKVVSTAVPAPGPSVASDWFTGEIAEAFTKGTIAVLTDISSGLSFRIYSTGGRNHPNCMPYSREDTAVMRAACGDQWNWTRRPCWISVNGVRYAASYTSMPEGKETINGSGYIGTFCVHFPGSLIDSTNEICTLHQAAIKTALKAG